MLEQISLTAQNNPEYALLMAFVFALIESLPFIGSAFPGMLTMPPIGYLMAKNDIPAIKTFLIIIIGAMIGDLVGFYLGVSCKKIAYQKAKTYNKTHWLSAGELFVEKYGPMSIIIGRFIGPFRSSIPLFAGIFDMKIAYFTLAAIPSVILWAIVHLAPGIIIAKFNYDILTHAESLVNIFMIGFCSLSIICATQTEKIGFIQPINKTIEQYISNMNFTDASKRYICRTMYLLCAIISMTITILRGGFDAINQAAYSLLSQQINIVIRLSLIQSSLCYIPFILILTASMSLLLVSKNKERGAFQLFASVGIAFTLCFILKHLIHYPRPEHIARFLGNQSLPSGHTCLTTAFILSYQSISKNKNSYKNYGRVFILATMLSRVLIGAHWISDILLGWMIGYLSHLASKILVREIRIIPVMTIFEKLPIGQIKHGLVSISRGKLISYYCILSLLYAVAAKKLSITPYLLQG